MKLPIMDEEDLVRQERALQHPVVRNGPTDLCWTAAFVGHRREKQLHFEFPWPKDSIFAEKPNTPTWWNK